MVGNIIKHISLEPQTNLSGQEINSALLHKKMLGECASFILPIYYDTHLIGFLQ